MQGSLSAKSFLGFALVCSIVACIKTPKAIDTGSRIAECRALDVKVTNYGAAAAFAAVLSGGSGLAAALPDNKDARNTAGIISIGTGAFSALTQYLSSRNTDRFAARGCALIFSFDTGSRAYRRGLEMSRDPAYEQRFLDALLEQTVRDSLEALRLKREMRNLQLVQVQEAMRKIREDSVARARADSIAKAKADSARKQ